MATAWQIHRKNPSAKLLLLEKDQISAHQTGHNSGVIHSGIYYKPGSEKVRNCIRGYNMLLDFCRDNEVEYELCGKLIVATDESELERMQNLFVRGQENGLEGLEILGPEQIKEIEPHVAGVRAIKVPQTGIVDYPGMTRKMAELVQAGGAEIHEGEKVTGLVEQADTVLVETDKGTYESKLAVNCAGLYSDRLSQMTQGRIDFKIVPFRGEYYELKESSRHLVKHLIYPVPDPAFPFLGVHFTRMIGGGVEAGPNAVLAFAREGYRKSDIKPGELIETLTYPGFIKLATKYMGYGMMEMHRSFSKAAFTRSLQKLIPEITSDDLVPGGAGVRAQALGRDGKLLDDFHFLESRHVLHVCNAPSPAATSSLSIGETLARKAGERV